MAPTPTIDALVHEWAEKLARVHDRIESCEVVIDRPHQRRLHGQQFHVRVHVAIPGADVIVSRDPEIGRAHEDVYVAIRDAFRAARRKLHDVATAAQPRPGDARIVAHV